MAKRTANFTSEEEQLLISLVEKYKVVIECKKSGAVTWQEKENTWKKIEKEFNSNNKRNYFRSLKNLKEKYLNLKKKTKEKYTTNRLNISQTGGGPYTPVQFSDVDICIKNIIGKQIEGLENPHDSCDGYFPICTGENRHTDEVSGSKISENSGSCEIYEDDVFYNTSNEVVVLEVFDDNLLNKDNICENEEAEQEKTNTDWSAYTPKNLKTAVSSKLKANNSCSPMKTRKPTILSKNNATKKYIGIQYELMEEKLNFVKLQKEKFLEEHDLRIDLLKKKIKITEKKLKSFRSS